MNLSTARKLMKGFNIGTLLGTGMSNAKTAKSETKQGLFTTRIMYLVPSDISGLGNLCAMATKACREACLFTAGRGAMSNVHRARMNKTRFWFAHREAFILVLSHELDRAKHSAAKVGKQLAARLNGTSDIVWEKVAPQLFADHPHVQFYDYTKIPQRFGNSWSLPSNYHLTFSRSESNEADCHTVMANGGNVCIVYDSIPKDIHSADMTDLRFLDPGPYPSGLGRIVGVTAKGKAKRDVSGFVVRS